jgi:hypothetical protein
MEAVCSTEMSVVHNTTWWRNPEDYSLNNRLRERVKTYSILLTFRSWEHIQLKDTLFLRYSKSVLKIILSCSRTRHEIVAFYKTQAA